MSFVVALRLTPRAVTAPTARLDMNNGRAVLVLHRYGEYSVQELLRDADVSTMMI